MPEILKSASRVYRNLRSAVRASPLRYPRRVQCNVCGWRGRRFRNDPWHLRCACPICGSGVRHRLLIAALAGTDEFSFDAIVAGKRVLHFAPERAIERRLRPLAAQYVTADLANPRRDINVDICNMAPIDSDAFDLLIACDVLEHLADDRAALGEVFRVLRPDGYAIFTVPQKDYLATTFGDPTIVDPGERERLFGQRDHVRIYGDDFPRILGAVGFQVTAVSENYFPAPLVAAHVLSPPVPSTHPLATNFRRVFFARKPGASSGGNQPARRAAA